MTFTDDEREEVARILEIVAKDGLPHPRDLDVALDAIQATIAPRHPWWVWVALSATSGAFGAVVAQAVRSWL